ncbi:twin transmembrane helix small protein [Candidatus Vesicomyidisocius sp. SY067_SCS001]|uniref:twin transmembrane helix small protein n=1 Tax=Candidatus Vesicomyidisocius sp. SY067_SCS001 TaxID=2732590 RepID=UPI0016850769|nr:twin transmembrane helix small protein [Candidatus Vesicomyosocius sp. SY067_SCS001]
MTQIIIIIIIIAILIALSIGLFGMLRGGKTGSNKMFKSLVIRVVLSLSLFIIVMFSAYMDWIEPNIIIMDAFSFQ